MVDRSRWHINKIEMQNFRCFEHLEISFDSELTVLVGTNGTGKTAVLECAAIMLSTVLREFGGQTRGFTTEDARLVPHDLDFQDAAGRMEAAYPVHAYLETALGDEWTYYWNRSRRSASGRTSWSEKNTEVASRAAEFFASAENEGTDAAPLPVIAFYGVERLVGVRRDRGTIPNSRSGAYDSSLDGKSDLARLSKYIEALSFAEFSAVRRGEEAPAASSQLSAISIACNTLLEATGWRDPEWNPTAGELVLRHSEHGFLPLSRLSSGIRIATGLVIDLVSRMARANPHLGSATLLNTVPGIVLIDEIDLHLHPTWQQRIVPLLRKVFPRVQFILTTHSPQVLSTVPARHIRVLDGTGVHGVEFSEGLRSDVVLDRVLGTPPRPDVEITHSLNEYLRLVDSGEGLSPRAVELRLELDEKFGGVGNEPRLAEADASIAFYDLDI